MTATTIERPEVAAELLAGPEAQVEHTKTLLTFVDKVTLNKNYERMSEFYHHWKTKGVVTPFPEWIQTCAKEYESDFTATQTIPSSFKLKKGFVLQYFGEDVTSVMQSIGRLVAGFIRTKGSVRKTYRVARNSYGGDTNDLVKHIDQAYVS